MNILEKLISLPKGEVITDKRILAVLKRVGIIYDYSPWGYLESQNVYFKDVWDGKESIEHDLTYTGKEIKDGELGSHSNPFPSREAFYKSKYSSSYINAEYKGIKFSSKYLSGCFNAYLYKSDGLCSSDKEVNRSMSLWGAVM